MTALQKVNLGTAPTGTDGDTVRTANVKANANVDVLATQAILTSSSPNAVRDLTSADMGKRVNFTPTIASTARFPAANTTGADQVVAVHNLSPTYDITMAVATGSGDTAPTIAVVKPGEMLTWETDGVSVWRTVGRKKSFDETVQGKLTAWGQTFLNGGVSVTGASSFSARPTFNGFTPLDSGNADLAGAIMYFARNTAPAGFLKANGLAVSRTTYAALFAAIGTTYGAGDGSTTFTLPDLRGYFLRSWDDSRGVDSGRNFGDLQAQNLPNHQHLLPLGFDGSSLWTTLASNPQYGSVVQNNGGSSSVQSQAPGSNGWNAQGSTTIRQAYSSATPASISGELRPANISLLACIKF